MILAKLAVGAVGTIVVTGALAFSEGVITVKVQEKRRDGDHVRLYLPAGAATLAAKLVPDSRLDCLPRQARELLPALEVAAAELARMPDTLFVEAEDGDEHVRIETRAGRLIIDVTSPREDVYIAVPLRTIRRIARDLRDAAPVPAD